MDRPGTSFCSSLSLVLLRQLLLQRVPVLQQGAQLATVLAILPSARHVLRHPKITLELLLLFLQLLNLLPVHTQAHTKHTCTHAHRCAHTHTHMHAHKRTYTVA